MSNTANAYKRNYYVSENAIDKLREKLSGKIKNLGKTDGELANALDEAVSINRDTPREKNRWLTYDYQGQTQTCVDLSGYFGDEIAICAVLAPNDNPRPSGPKQAVITVTDGDYIERLKPIDIGALDGAKSTMADLMPETLRTMKLPTQQDRARQAAIPPAVIERVKETRIISYRDRDGREVYEERVADEAMERVSNLLDAGVPHAAIRIWKQVRTKVRIEVE